MLLSEIHEDQSLVGVVPQQLVKVVSVKPFGAGIKLFYELPDGSTGSCILYDTDAAQVAVATQGAPWTFDAPASHFKLAAEAYRIDLAHLFDPMMAVHASNVEPLPHQITAVYEAMLPRQPLRFVLADDPGAGKTIMAGLLIRELLMRADATRVLVVAPGSLVEQWQDELSDKFDLSFQIFSPQLVEVSKSGNPFSEIDLLIGRVDQLSRSPDYLAKLSQSSWDLVIIDEAHKCSASYSGDQVKKTKRFELAETLGGVTRHFLLMTATPHSGYEANFQLFLSLLDSDRFLGKFRQGVHKVDVSDLMRRMVKEQLLKFDGTRLFPERRAYTVQYTLSALERALYDAVTDYVRDEMNRAEKLANKKHRSVVGFAMTGLQRRLASSPEAIFQSIKRRHKKLAARIAEEKHQAAATAAGFSGPLPLSEVLAPSLLSSLDHGDLQEDLPAEQFEAVEADIVDQATAAQTLQELQLELQTLAKLEAQAKAVVESSKDCKWEKLSEVLQTHHLMRGPDGLQRKLILFTEHRDTLNYLADKIRGLLGSQEAVVLIHGAVKREVRRDVQERFRHDKAVRVLIATDAAGEGVNLQNAHLMINYDLPWNPNRIEQRFGRIHRIGQTEVCHLWNLVAADTREGQVFDRLFQKLEKIRETLGGQVFDILGDVFEGTPLKELLMQAIMYGEQPEVRAKLLEKVEGALDPDKVQKILDDNALCQEVIGGDKLFQVKEEMERAEARKLQPFFVRSFFDAAFSMFGGELRPREPGRFEVPNVPGVVVERWREEGKRATLLKKYERVCFEKRAVRVDKAGAPVAALLHPGHPLTQAVTKLTLATFQPTLKQGAVLLDPLDMGDTPRLLLLLDHTVRDGKGAISSRRLQFVALDPQGQATDAGWAPHLDLQPLPDDALPAIQPLLTAPWLSQGLEARAEEYAAAHLVQAHLEEVKLRRQAYVAKVRAAVHERLVKEISFLNSLVTKFKADAKANKPAAKGSLELAERRLEDVNARLAARTADLDKMSNIAANAPVIVGGALVIPQGLLTSLLGHPAPAPSTPDSPDAAARAHIEQVAMRAVRAAEEARGHTVIDVSRENCGWDLTSIPPSPSAPPRHIEVKGRAKGATTVTVTRNELLCALNQADKFILAIVLVNGDTYDGPFYIPQPFTQEPDWATTSVNFNLSKLLSQSVSP